MGGIMSKTLKKDTIEFKQLVLNKEEYRIGDTIRVFEENDDTSFAEIVKIWRNPKKADAFARIKWFFKPKDVFERIPEFISNAELMKSDLEQDISVQSIYGKIEVLPISEYHAKDEVDSDVFFTRSYFDSKTKLIRPQLSHWKRSCVCESILNPDHLYVSCDKCLQLFHPNCVNYEECDFWTCEKCYKELLE